MFFWLLIALVLLLSMGFVWWFHRKSLRVGVLEDTSDQLLYKIRISEVERDYHDGRLDEQSAEIAKVEAARLLLNARSLTTNQTRAAYTPSRMMLVGNIATLPLLCLALYLFVGSPPQVRFPQEDVSELTEQSLDQLLETAEQRLKENPDDLRGWRVVAPVYIRTGRLDDAAVAFQNILRIEGPSTQILSALGEVMVSKTQGVVGKDALELFEQAIALDTRNATASFFVGLHAAQNDDREKARLVWQAMIDNSTGNEDWIEAIRQRIVNLDVEPDVSQSGEQTADPAIQSLPKEQRTLIDNMISGLAERLAEDPSDKPGWVRLVRAYMVLGQKDDALLSIDKAEETHADDDSFMEDLRKLVTDFEQNSSTTGDAQ